MGVQSPAPASPDALLVSAPPETGRCGIHDFAGRLAAALTRTGLRASVLDHRDWSLGGMRHLLAASRAARPGVVHFQFPMIVGRRSLGPQLLGFALPGPQVVTLHEYSSFSRLRRATLTGFAARADGLVFTTAFERDLFLAAHPGCAARASVVPIGSNVPFLAPGAERERSVIHFGQLKPGRGLEDFLALARLAAAGGKDWRFRVVGAPVSWAGDFLDRAQASASGVEWHLDAADDEAARLLTRAGAAYLPYPDGVSERRGSLIAALGNGVPVVTTAGPFRTPALDGAVAYAATPAEALVRLEAIFSSPPQAERMREAGLRLARGFDWDAIARAYARVYESARRVRAAARPEARPRVA